MKLWADSQKELYSNSLRTNRQCQTSVAHCGSVATPRQERAMWSLSLGWWTPSQVTFAGIRSESRPRHWVEWQPGRLETRSCRKFSVRTSIDQKWFRPDQFSLSLLLSTPPDIMLPSGLLVSMESRRIISVRIIKWSWRVLHIFVRVSLIDYCRSLRFI